MFRNKTLGIITATFAIAAFVGSAQAATFTWVQGGDQTNWEDASNWDVAGVPPQAVAGTDLVFSNAASGQIGQNPGTAKVTIGSMSWSTGFTLQSFGTWSNKSTGVFVDTGTSDPAIATASNGAHMATYYVNFNLASDLKLVGSGRLTVRANNTSGVQGVGGFIVTDGMRLDFVRTHNNDDYSYSGGVTIESGAIVNTTGRNSGNGALGTGRLTIEEGGQLQTVNDALGANAATFIIDGSTDGTTLLITGAGSNLNASGEWTFDLTGFGGSVGDTFSIITGAASYVGGDFSVAGATESGGVWSGASGLSTFEFNQSTGILEVTGLVPEPASLALLGLAHC